MTTRIKRWLMKLVDYLREPREHSPTQIVLITLGFGLLCTFFLGMLSYFVVTKYFASSTSKDTAITVLKAIVDVDGFLLAFSGVIMSITLRRREVTLFMRSPVFFLVFWMAVLLFGSSILCGLGAMTTVDNEGHATRGLLATPVLLSFLGIGFITTFATFSMLVLPSVEIISEEEEGSEEDKSD